VVLQAKVDKSVRSKADTNVGRENGGGEWEVRLLLGERG